tara:strand:- start:709 stop:2298 length:1590 start_codon:yes stop_codon:yes gene_type:complete
MSVLPSLPAEEGEPCLFWTPDAFKGWVKERQLAWMALPQHPDAYYHNYLMPGEVMRTFEWTSEELGRFEHVLREHPGKVSCNAWGLLSLHIPGRTGAQCAMQYERITSGASGGASSAAPACGTAVRSTPTRAAPRSASPTSVAPLVSLTTNSANKKLPPLPRADASTTKPGVFSARRAAATLPRTELLSVGGLKLKGDVSPSPATGNQSEAADRPAGLPEAALKGVAALLSYDEVALPAEPLLAAGEGRTVEEATAPADEASNRALHPLSAVPNTQQQPTAKAAAKKKAASKKKKSRPAARGSKSISATDSTALAGARVASPRKRLCGPSRADVCRTLSLMLASAQTEHEAAAAAVVTPPLDGSLDSLPVPTLFPAVSAPLPRIIVQHNAHATDAVFTHRAVPPLLSSAQALSLQEDALSEISTQRRWLQEVFQTELRRAALLPPSSAAITRDQALEETRQSVRAVLNKFERERRELLTRERIQTESLNAMRAWEEAGRPQREPGAMPVFMLYDPKIAYGALPPLEAAR